MAILEHEVRLQSGSAITGLNRRLFSHKDYLAIANAGVFDGQRVELIEGEIVEMAPIGDAHAAITEPIVDLLKASFGLGFTVRNQAPVTLSGQLSSEPQPDVVVAVGSWRDYVLRKPNSAEIKLIVEVADSSLKNDRTTKAALYSSAEISEYWIVNLVDNLLEIYRDPVDGTYHSVTVHAPGALVMPLHAATSIAVQDFIP